MSEQTVKAVEDEINSNSMDEKSFAPTTLKSAKSSIRNLPPFNIPPPTKAAPLLTEQSTFSGLGMESLYEGSSSLPVPPTMVLCDSTPVRSSPPPLSMCNINTTTQVERSPSPEQRPSSGGKDVRTVSNLTNPRTPPITGVIGTDRVVETSPGNRQGGESSPFRALRSSPSYFNGPTATETDTDNDKTPRAARDDDTPVSENKRKREMQSHRIAKRAESVVPCSLPDDVGQAIAQTQVDRILDTDREGDTNMEQQPSDELREGRAENGEIGNESLQKKRKIDIGSGPKETPKSVAKLQTKRSSVSGSADKGKLAKDLSTKKTRPKPAPRLSIVASKSTTPVTGRASPDDQKPGENNSPGAPATSTHFYRVFAIFKDNKMHYHPATVVPTPNVALSHVKVVFDDGTEDVVDRSHVRRLSLKVGDIIKCDMVTMKKNLWVIVGFPSVEPFDANANDNPWNRFTDSEGHLSVFIRPKKKGPYPGDGEGSFGESMEVPITRIYIIKSLWGQFSQRNFNFHAISRQLSAGISPVVLSRPETPFSKDSRTTPLLPSATSVSKGLATAGTGKKSSTSGGRTTGIFSGMVFALTFGDNDFEKRAITAKILAHGGRILDRGFDEMFKPLGGTKHRSMTSNPTSSDTEKDMDSDADVNGSDEGLKPLLDTEEVGFACVIADKYCRRVKFLQALALGIPCLSGKWIEDCVKKNMILNWGMYLLPAGESTYLSGAIRSRVMPIFSAASSRFVSIIEERNKLLDGYCVLLVMGRRKKTREKRKPYHFLTHALGAKEVLQVSSVEEANEILKVGNGEGSCSRWDLVYVDAATNKSTGGKDKLWVGVPTVWRKPRVVDDEWVIQSLILGRLLEEP
ncbi:hypothetical protein BDZ91DRAFT_710025 [Kalaharituber pfeilii]|nr:hypothetical protein BDZ91DRAFT_710025 [Kalaharituber pfeilii]